MTIDIKAQLELLRELQGIDIHLREIEEELSSIPRQVEEVKSEWVQVQDLLKEKEAEKAGSEKERRELETELEDSEARLREREGKLFAIKTNKEYQAALKEIADGKRANHEREDAILKLMEKIDTLSKEITQLSSQAADKEAEFRKDEEELESKKKELEKASEVRVAELEKIKGQVDKAVLDRYDFIRVRYLDPLAAVKNGICQGCNMNIPPQMYIELLKGLKIHFCPNCRRFIYVGEEKEDNAGEASDET